MLGVALELRGQCDGCGQPLPINGCVDHIVCSGCQRGHALGAETWKMLLEDEVSSVDELEMNEGRHRSVMSGSGGYHLMVGHQHPRCGRCKTTIPDEAASDAFLDRGWVGCVGCGEKMSLRRAPPAVAALGAFALVGEDPKLVASGLASGQAPMVTATATASGPVVLFCPSCNGPLQVDGASRMVSCQYCSTGVYLPDDVWHRLHPVATVSRWYLWLPEQDKAQRALARFAWSSVEDMAIAPGVIMFCTGNGRLGEHGRDGLAVWCMGADLAVRWARMDIDLDESGTKLALDREGRLIVWNASKHSAVVLSSVDGSTLGTLGGREPEGARVHGFDLARCTDLFADPDGTLLGYMGEKRLVRYTRDGEGIATWPPRGGLFGPKEEKLSPLFDRSHRLSSPEDVPYIEGVGHHPLWMEIDLELGHDGRLYGKRSQQLVCFDRDGKRVYRVSVAVDSICSHGLGADASGHAYVLGYMRGDSNPHVLIRASPDGACSVIATDRRHGGVLGSETDLYVAPDGTMVMLSSDQVRIVGPDGRLVLLNAAAKEHEAKQDARAARLA